MSRLRTFLARDNWVAACEFDPSSDTDVFSRISDKVKENIQLDIKSYVILDIDSTLYEVAPRTVRILREAAEALREGIPAPVCEALSRLDEPTAGYSLEDTWANLGLCLKDAELGAAREQLRTYWRERFFSNDYLEHDKPYPGMPEFAKELYDLGAELVYLTGRDEPGMRVGTLRILARDGFPIAVPRTQLKMKAGREFDDVEHKVGVAQNLCADGEVVASFENEPRNFVALFQALPSAIHVFVDTICSEQPAPVIQGAYRLRRFRA